MVLLRAFVGCESADVQEEPAPTPARPLELLLLAAAHLSEFGFGAPWARRHPGSQAGWCWVLGLRSPWGYRLRVVSGSAHAAREGQKP